MRISKNYKMREFSVSSSFPHLATGVPKEFQCNVVNLVLALLQPINDATGWSNYISSGYRSPMLNSRVGGSPSSQHLKGEASDNNFYYYQNGKKISVTPYEVAKKVKWLNLDFDQMILYPTFIHLSFKVGANRRQVLYSSTYKGKRL